MKELAAAWLSSAEMDLENIKRVRDDVFLTPVSCFHSHQSVEKTVKAFLEASKTKIPKTHDLLRLWGLLSEHLDFKIDMEILQKLNDLYIDSRYPGDLGLLPNGKPTIADAVEFYEFAEFIYNKILMEIKKLDEKG